MMPFPPAAYPQAAYPQAAYPQQQAQSYAQAAYPPQQQAYAQAPAAPMVPQVPTDAWAQLDWAISQIEATDVLWARALLSVMHSPAGSDARVFGDLAAAVLTAFEPDSLSHSALMQWSQMLTQQRTAPPPQTPLPSARPAQRSTAAAAAGRRAMVRPLR